MIRACPSCKGRRPKDLPEELCRRLDSVAQAGVLLGDDIDGFAAFLEDLEFV